MLISNGPISKNKVAIEVLLTAILSLCFDLLQLRTGKATIRSLTK